MAVLTTYIEVLCPRDGSKVDIAKTCNGCKDLKHTGIQGGFRMYVVCGYGEKKEPFNPNLWEPGRFEQDSAEKELTQMEEEVPEESEPR